LAQIAREQGLAAVPVVKRRARVSLASDAFAALVPDAVALPAAWDAFPVSSVPARLRVCATLPPGAAPCRRIADRVLPAKPAAVLLRAQAAARVVAAWVP
jgi:hypothetical protein